jgi:hypothetical protein
MKTESEKDRVIAGPFAIEPKLRLIGLPEQETPCAVLWIKINEDDEAAYYLTQATADDLLDAITKLFPHRSFKVPA